jgi:hypothetical protein
MQHIDNMESQIFAIVDASNLHVIADISVDKVNRFVAQLRPPSHSMSLPCHIHSDYSYACDERRVIEDHTVPIPGSVISMLQTAEGIHDDQYPSKHTSAIWLATIT